MADLHRHRNQPETSQQIICPLYNIVANTIPVDLGVYLIWHPRYAVLDAGSGKIAGRLKVHRDDGEFYLFTPKEDICVTFAEIKCTAPDFLDS